MKTQKKETTPVEVSSDSATLPALDEMGEIKKFIQKRRLQNKILKKITEELQANKTTELERNKTA